MTVWPSDHSTTSTTLVMNTVESEHWLLGNAHNTRDLYNINGLTRQLPAPSRRTARLYNSECTAASKGQTVTPDQWPIINGGRHGRNKMEANQETLKVRQVHSSGGGGVRLIDSTRENDQVHFPQNSEVNYEENAVAEILYSKEFNLQKQMATLNF
ncbi:hypothetical protein J6590_017883 [Homalodisca vitripennis]|nr:hypothetical protein J6590_017883 [Homalodisca vitripennis]